PIVIETTQEFIERNGVKLIPLTTLSPEGIALAPVREWLLPSGASLQKQHDTGPLTHIEAPTTKRELLEAKFRYHDVLRSAAARHFQKIKAGLLNPHAARRGIGWDDEAVKLFGRQPPDDHFGEKALLTLKAIYLEHNNECNDLSEQLDQLPEVVAARREAAERVEREARYAEQRRREAEEAVRKIQAITLNGDKPNKHQRQWNKMQARIAGIEAEHGL